MWRCSTASNRSASPVPPAVSARSWPLYDIKAARLVVVADAVGQVAGRQGVLWWSTGGPQTITWHSLDLTTLTR